MIENIITTFETNLTWFYISDCKPEIGRWVFLYSKYKDFTVTNNTYFIQKAIVDIDRWAYAPEME